MTFATWIDTFLEEKQIDRDESFTVEGPVYGENLMTYGVVVDTMKIAPAHEREKIKTMIVKIDFRNGDVRHFLRHCAKAIAL